jgi:hypothetical protein
MMMMMMMMMMMIHPQMHHQVMLYLIMIKTFSPVPISFSMASWSSSQIFFAFNLSAPELGPNTGENIFSEYNTMQIQ